MYLFNLVSVVFFGLFYFFSFIFLSVANQELLANPQTSTSPKAVWPIIKGFILFLFGEFLNFLNFSEFAEFLNFLNFLNFSEFSELF